MLYQYKCPNCDHEFDVQKPLAKMYDEERCPVCREVAERQISRTSFQLKGQGWAKDNYHKPKGPQ